MLELVIDLKSVQIFQRIYNWGSAYTESSFVLVMINKFFNCLIPGPFAKFDHKIKKKNSSKIYRSVRKYLMM